MNAMSYRRLRARQAGPARAASVQSIRNGGRRNVVGRFASSALSQRRVPSAWDECAAVRPAVQGRTVQEPEAEMPKINIVRGGVYANSREVFAREVLEITFGNVIYNDYALSDGAPIGRRCVCSLEAFQRWAARPLDPVESSRLQRDVGPAREAAQLAALIRSVLAAAPDELIRGEFYRRGLDRPLLSDQPTRASTVTADRAVGGRGRDNVSRDRNQKADRPVSRRRRK
jgi:hypothetical protein